MNSYDSDSPGEKLPVPMALGCGLLMGGADAIPGVSGGTIALILGIYRRFIRSLSDVVRFPFLLKRAQGRQDLKQAFGFLIPLGVGVLVSYFLATKLLVGKSENPGLMLRAETAPICYAFFFGLVLLSLREPWKRVKNLRGYHWAIAALACAASAAFAGLPRSGLESTPLVLILAGAGAISLMILPGVSGSLFLVIIGQYTVVAGAVHDRDVMTLLIFLLGIGVGVITFIPLLRRLLRHYHDGTFVALTGLMAGSLRALWPWKEGYDPKVDAMNNIPPHHAIALSLLAALAGAVVVWLLTRIEKRINKKGRQSE